MIGKIDSENVGEFIEFLKAMEGKSKRSNTITGHYGISDEKGEETIKDMLCSFIKEPKYTDTLDQFFPHVDAETRANIYAFAVAFIQYQKFQEE